MSFCQFKALIGIISEEYPSIPLNIQVSFYYSRFLDLHLHYDSSTARINHTLAYKEVSSFNFVPCTSNVPSAYKHAIVPSYLYRIHSRCTEPEDRNHHLSFMNKILKKRHQDPVKVKTRTLKYFNKKSKERVINTKVISLVTYDKVSSRHKFMSKISTSASPNLRLVFKTCPKLCSVLSSKRCIINILKNNLDQ